MLHLEGIKAPSTMKTLIIALLHRPWSVHPCPTRPLCNHVAYLNELTWCAISQVRHAFITCMRLSTVNVGICHVRQG